jgi:hypothetical protein
VADSCAEQSLEVEGRSRAFPIWELAMARRFGARDRADSRGGSGACSNGRRARAPETVTRLRRRRKALEGEPHEWIRHETRPAGVGGQRRQEVEKTWRRRRPGEANPAKKAAAPRGDTL